MSDEAGRRPWIKYEILDDEATLRRLVEEGKSDEEIGRMANCKARCVAHYRVQLGMRRKPGSQPRPGINYEILGKPDTLRRLYIVEGRTAESIAAMAGCTPVVVGRWLRLFGIPVRKRGEVSPARAVIREISREQLRVVVARAYGRARRCSPACPGWEDCLDDEGPCRMIRAA